MNQFDNLELDAESFSWYDLLGIDRWETWTPVFGSITLVGTPVYSGRHKELGRQCFFQAQIVPGTSIATTAGTDYMNLPISAKGYGGTGVMVNASTKVDVGPVTFDVANSRCYLPTQIASTDTFVLAGQYEI